MKCDEVDYKVFGDDLQFVEIELDPGEKVIAEAGAMMYMDEEITYEAKMGDGSKPEEGFMDKVFSVGKRLVTGESLFMTHFCNGGSGKKHVAFGAPYPGSIIPMDMSQITGNELLCQKDAFLCAAIGTEVSIAFTKKFGVGLFGGEGFILQKLSGDGMAFIHAGGAIYERTLENETIMVDTGCVVAFESSINYDIQRAGNLKSMVFGGEGLFMAKLSGKGKIWLQSLPFSRLADRIIKSAPSAGGSQKGEGSILGGLSRLMER